ncbi:UNVERIFIED_CONTAM: hypothetical protein NCL1_13094 [Trichonephila clavipes]
MTSVAVITAEYNCIQVSGKSRFIITLAIGIQKMGFLPRILHFFFSIHQQSYFIIIVTHAIQHLKFLIVRKSP